MLCSKGENGIFRVFSNSSLSGGGVSDSKSEYSFYSVDRRKERRIHLLIPSHNNVSLVLISPLLHVQSAEGKKRTMVGAHIGTTFTRPH